MEKKILKIITAIFFIIMITFTFISRRTAVEMLPEIEEVYAEYVEGKLILPETAVDRDEKGNCIVYVLWEEESILGTVTIAKRKNVEIVEEKGNDVIVEGVLEISHRPFVKDVAVGITDGDRVRSKKNG